MWGSKWAVFFVLAVAAAVLRDIMLASVLPPLAADEETVAKDASVTPAPTPAAAAAPSGERNRVSASLRAVVPDWEASMPSMTMLGGRLDSRADSRRSAFAAVMET